MRSLFLLPYRYTLVSRNVNKISTVYSLLIILFAFVTIVTFSVSNYVTEKLTFDLGAEDALPQSPAELDYQASISEIVVKKHDTLAKIFSSQQISSSEILRITDKIKESKVSFTLKPGQVITFDYSVADGDRDQHAVNDYLLKEITINVDKLRSIVISKSEKNYSIRDVTVPLKKMYVKHHVTIQNSFTSSLSELGISAANIQELASAYSYDIDFQRQIKTGDTISVICEKFYTEEGQFIHNGKILFATLNLSGSNHNIYWFSDPKYKKPQYYSENGRSIKRNLLRTPINVARISSSFGKRHHPILGYTKMHKGVDFVAPTGTPIFAAGDGVITELGYKGAYGNIVKIKHSSNLTTAYAHASKFAKNLKTGSIVKQGQVIAYVGATGRATGPHCHFEVIINGKHVNPVSVQTTPGVELKDESLKLFMAHKKLLKNYAEKIADGVPLEFASL